LLLQIAVGGGIWLVAAAGVLFGPARGVIEKDSPLWEVIRAARSGKRRRTGQAGA
ncbi:MAG: hypothetical protein HKN12_06655, partial [Gemmatimonadetes bacterium]|nr:hypothetical protein [Gemmatimonadota bacterium]